MREVFSTAIASACPTMSASFNHKTLSKTNSTNLGHRWYLMNTCLIYYTLGLLNERKLQHMSNTNYLIIIVPENIRTGGRFNCVHIVNVQVMWKNVLSKI